MEDINKELGVLPRKKTWKKPCLTILRILHTENYEGNGNDGGTHGVNES